MSSSIASAPTQPLTISDLEQTIAYALESLRPAPLSDTITAAFPYLLPKGLRLRVQLEEDGRKKRSTAAASNWTPETGEIVIYFERDADSYRSESPNRDSVASVITSNPAAQSVATRSEVSPEYPSRGGSIAAVQIAPSVPAIKSSENKSIPFGLEEVTPLQIQQCCVALSDSEKAGKSFIALKWFRDEALPKYKFDWTATPESRQQVLAKAIEGGMVRTSRIPNPKAPQHPTTTVALNRVEAPQGLASRFNPIPVRGEPVSVSMMRDRGNY